MQVHFIDVGQGDCIYIAAGTENMLIDCGEADESVRAVGYLRDMGVRRLDYVIGTHPHSDHTGGMDNIINSFGIGEFIIPHLDDEDIPLTPEHIRARTIGRLFQDPLKGTAPDMSIEENLALAAGELLTLLLGIQDLLGTFIDFLSFVLRKGIDLLDVP